MPSADDGLITAIELVLTGAELPQAATLLKRARDGNRVRGHPDGRDCACACFGHLVPGRQAERWPGRASGKARRLRAGTSPAGFRVEYTTETTSGCLVAWR
jgi:hypothetical protein